jgi:glycosyltransferase involved in cell wall biosynthesis
MNVLRGNDAPLPGAGPSGRIALVTSALEGGGAQRAFAKLASGIAATGRDVDLVVGRARGPYLAEVIPEVRVVDLDVRRFAHAVLPLARYLRRTRPIAVYSALDYVNVVTVVAHALSRVDARLVVSERNTLSVAAGNSARARTRLMPTLVRRAYPRSDAVVAVSQGVADDLVDRCGLAADTVHVLHNPVVTPQMLRMRDEPVTHPWLRTPSAPVVLAAGRFVPQKDFASLLEAFATVRRARDSRLVILGDGPLRGDLERQAEALGIAEDVSLPGFCDNPYPAMAAADVFVLSSRWEGSPGALIEAMACGTRVVAIDCPSGPRQVLDGGRHGRLVPLGDVAALAAGIHDALAGRFEVPAPESWALYDQQAAVEACLRLLEVSA